MNVYDAIQQANDLLPGQPVPEGTVDPRWQAVIGVGAFVESDPQAVWEFIVTWGNHPQEDVRSAVATCLLEHLLAGQFRRYFPKVERLVKASPEFAGMFDTCWKSGQAAEPYNAVRFDRLQNRRRKRV